jgi:hypothetical protein
MRMVLLVATVLMFGCADGLDTAGREYAAFPAFGDEFTLRVGERVLIEAAALDLRFFEVAADSRCPHRCVWEGDGAVVIETTPEFADAEHHTLHTTLEPKAIDLGLVRVTLIRLDPYPQDPEPIPREDYAATFVVEESP